MDCLACGITPSPATREHVFSSWLLKEFGPDSSMALYRHSGDGGQRQVRAEIRLDSFRLKKICEDCNNGWMSKLEESAKPLILALIKEGRKLDSLLEDERRTLVREFQRLDVRPRDIRGLRPVATERDRHASLCIVAGRIVVAADLLALTQRRTDYRKQAV